MNLVHERRACVALSLCLKKIVLSALKSMIILLKSEYVFVLKRSVRFGDLTALGHNQRSLNKDWDP
jgi:hypothetical protein